MTTTADTRDPWLAIELRHLAALDAIESEGTFSEAALSLGYVQSAVSGQLAMLERLTGARLVERSRRPGPQQLTDAGALLLAHSRDILEELDVARRRLSAAEDASATGFRIVVGTGLSDGHVGSVLSAVLSNLPGLVLSKVETLDCAALGRALVEGEADVALMDLPFCQEDIATAEIGRRPPELVVQADSPLARRVGAPTLQELCHLPLVVWREGRDPSRIELELEERGLRPRVAARVDASDTVASLVRTGLGAAVLPEGAVAGDDALATVALGEQLPARTLGVGWHRSRSREPVLRRFIHLACRLREEP